VPGRLLSERSLTRTVALSAGLLGWLVAQRATVWLFEHSHQTEAGSVTHHHPYAPSAVLIATTVMAVSLVALTLTGPSRNRESPTAGRTRLGSGGQPRGLDWQGAHGALAAAAFVGAEALEHRSLSQLGSSAAFLGVGALVHVTGVSAGWWLGAILARRATRLFVVSAQPRVPLRTALRLVTTRSRLRSATAPTTRTSRGPPRAWSHVSRIERSANRLTLTSAHARLGTGHV
jgi:hypothetical protein